MPLRRCAWLLIVAGLLPAAARAVEVDSLAVTQDGPRYRVAMKVRLDALPGDAYAVFADYRNLPLINRAVQSALLLPETTTPDVWRLQTQVHMCFSFFCKTLQQVQDMRGFPEVAGGRFSARVLPDRSDMRYGQAEWNLTDCKPLAPTCLEFKAELEPKFWIPPLIGPWVMERKLRQEAVQTSEGIERLARERAAPATAAP